jgi:acyl-CoA dehydrogenase
MTATVFYERRKVSRPIDFSNRRIVKRRKQEIAVSEEQRRLASQVRRYEREAFKIPVRLKVQEKEIAGYTHDVCPEGLLVFADTRLSAGTPMSLKFSFGEHVCHLNVSGQVVFCRLSEHGGKTRHAIGIKFSGVQDFEKKILTSAIEELKHSPATQEKSLLKILVSSDALAQEITGVSAKTPQTVEKKPNVDDQSAVHASKATSKGSQNLFEETISRDRAGVNFVLTEEQKALQEAVRKFTQKEILPVAAYYDKTGEFPWGVIKKAFELGIFTCYIPPKYGGGGLGVFETALITEELAAGCVAMATSIMVNLLGVSPLLIAGTEEQKDKFLVPYCRQLTLFSFCFTEPDAGSDPSRIATKADLVGDHYVLNGSKCFITNGGVADYFIVFATLDKSLGTKGLTAFLTPTNAKGIKIGKVLDKMGQRASNTVEIFFEDVRIPRENRIGAEGEGYKTALFSISRSRINVAAGAVGIARTAMEHALRYVQKRVQFNQPLAGFQYVQFRLADMAGFIDAARLLTWRAARAHDRGQRFAKEASMAKDFAGDVVMKATSEALDLLGGYGYSKEYPMEKLMRDAKLMQIYEGPSPIHKTIIYKELAKEYGL